MRPVLVIAALTALTLTDAVAQPLQGARYGEAMERLQAMDLDGDGRITRAEAAAAREKAFHKLDANGDGVVDASEASAGRAGRRVMAADADRDGRVTLAEWRAAPFPLFERFDANKDNVIDRDELAKAAELAQQLRQGTP